MSDLKKSSSRQQQVEEILRSLQDMKYGTLLIVVHDGQIVQVERTEKTRFTT